MKKPKRWFWRLHPARKLSRKAKAYLSWIAKGSYEVTVYCSYEAKKPTDTRNIEIRYFQKTPRLDKDKALNKAQKIWYQVDEEFPFTPNKFEAIGIEKCTQRRSGWCVWIERPSSGNKYKSKDWNEKVWRNFRIGIDVDSAKQLSAVKRILKANKVKYSIKDSTNGWHIKIKKSWRTPEENFKVRTMFRDDSMRIEIDRKRLRDNFPEWIDTLFDKKVVM